MKLFLRRKIQRAFQNDIELKQKIINDYYELVQSKNKYIKTLEKDNESLKEITFFIRNYKNYIEILKERILELEIKRDELKKNKWVIQYI